MVHAAGRFRGAPDSRSVPRGGRWAWLILLLSLVVTHRAQGQGDGSPWEAAPTTPDRRLPRELTSFADLLPLYGVQPPDMAAIVDGAELSVSERQTLLRLLFRSPGFPLLELERWANDGPGLLEVAENPHAYRARPLRLRGRLQQITIEQVPEGIRTGVGFDQFYRVALETDLGLNVLVFTREIPSLWQRSVPRGAVAGAVGLFLKQGSGAGSGPLMVVAPRVAWYPEQPNEALGVSDDHVWLAGRGMDQGLFDSVRQHNRRPLDGHDRECFYQLLALVGSAETAEIEQRAQVGDDLAPLLQHPERYHGRLVTMQGTARRVTRIIVSERDLKQRFGIDHYFQIDLFVPLGKQVVRLGHSADDQDGPTFANRFPVTVCVRELPDGLREGDDLHQQIRVAAVYFKLWAYRSRFVTSFNERQLQISPMLIARRPAVIVSSASSRRDAGVGLALVFLAALAGIWFWVWRYTRDDARAARRSTQRRFSVPDGQSLDDLNLPQQSGPDFSGLSDVAGPPSDS